MAINNTLDPVTQNTAAPSIDNVVLDSVVPPSSKLDADQYMVNDLDGVTENLSGSGNLNYQLLQSRLLADDAGGNPSYGASRVGADMFEAGAVPSQGVQPAPLPETGMTMAANPDTTDNAGGNADAMQVQGSPDPSASLPQPLESGMSPQLPAGPDFDALSTDSSVTASDSTNTTITNSNNTIDSHDTIITTYNTTNNITTNNFYNESTVINGGNTNINFGNVTIGGNTNIINVGDITIGGGGGGGGGGGNIIEVIVNNTTDLVENITHDVTDVVINLGDNVTDILGDVTETVTQIVGSTTGIIEQLLGTVDNTVTTVTQDVLTPVIGNVTDILGNTTDIVGDVLGTVTDDVLTPVLGNVTDILGDTTGVVGDVLGTVTDDVLTPVLGNVTDVLGDATGIVGGLLGGIGDGDGVALPDVTQPVIAAVTDVTGNILPPVIDTVESVVSDIVQSVLGDVTGNILGAVGDLPLVGGLLGGGLLGNVINPDAIAGSSILELGSAPAADYDIATAGDMNGLTTALLGDTGNVTIDLVEDIAGDIDLNLGLNQALLGGGSEVAESVHDVSIGLNIDILGHDIATDGIGLNLDIVEQITGDIDLNLDVATNILGDVADGLLDSAPGGADTFAEPLGGLLSGVGDGLLGAIDQGNDQSLLLDNQILSQLTDNLANNPEDIVADALSGADDTVSNVINTVTQIDLGDMLGNVMGGMDDLNAGLAGAIAGVSSSGYAEAPLAGLIEQASGIADTPWVEPLTSTLTDIVQSPADLVGSVLSDPVGGLTGALGDVLGGGDHGLGGGGGGNAVHSIVRGLFG